MTKAHGGDAPKAELSPDTTVTIAGRAPFAHHGYVNTPVYHASTLLYRSAEDYVARRGPYEYARRGTPTSEALEKALQEIEGPLAPASRCCRRDCPPSALRFRRCCAPAITSWSPTAATAPPAAFATRC